MKITNDFFSNLLRAANVKEKENCYSFTIAEKESGLRMDVFLSRNCPSLSRAQIKKAADAGKIEVNGVRAKAGRRLSKDDRVVFEKPAAVDSNTVPEDIPLTVVYEDRFFLVIDKPAGMVVHPAAGNYSGTLVNALLFHCKDLSGIGGVMRPGIVHRLDKGTSGLLIAAKSDETHRGLAAQFKRREVKKTYHALVHGNVKGEEGIIDAPVGRDIADRKKMSTRSRRGKDARTRWRVCERFGVATLLEVEIETGRTHQIRVHLTALGYPVIGDTVYGGGRARNAADSVLKEKLKAMRRHALHASRLSFVHPITGSLMSFSSSLPEDMASLCDFLRKHNSEQ
jgi:23S rRNA pseudouridine1911/1915/1917 synthase